MIFDQVIVAQATPIGAGTLCIIRASGHDVFKIAQNFITLTRGGSFFLEDKFLLKPNGIYHAKIFDQSILIDEVMVSIFVAPKSFTGENSLEITCHNNPIISSNIISLFLKYGARLAEAGEFSKRSFLNGKIDLCQAEAICEIIRAQNQVALQVSLGQLEGSLSGLLNDLASSLMTLAATLEAWFEFAEEELADLSFDEMLLSQLGMIRQKIDALIFSSSNQERLQQGVRVAIVGPSNAGKSTLFNALLGKKRALVSDIAGTTRDVVEATLSRESGLWTLADTAGFRETSDYLENLGIDKSNQELVSCDILLFVLDSSREIEPQEELLFNKIIADFSEKIILVLNKKDLGVCELVQRLAENKELSNIIMSGYTGENLAELQSLIDQKSINILNSGASCFVLNKRQAFLVQQLDFELQHINRMFLEHVPHEVIIIRLKEVLFLLGNFTGKNLSEEILSKIFSSFCIGK